MAIAVAVAVAAAVAATLELGTASHSPRDLLEFPFLGALTVVNCMVVARLVAGFKRAEVRETVQAIVRDTSHELRTPITIARGHAELLWEASHGRVAISDVEIVIDELDRLSRLTDRMLVLAATDPIVLVREPVDLDGLLKSRVRRWSVAAVRNWNLSVAIDQLVLVDATRLTAALDALIENALHHTEGGDTIGVDASVSSGILTLAVSDEGAGMERDQLERLLAELAEDRVALSGRPGGTGLGLRIVKTVAEAHGGWITASSQPHLKTTFSIHFPMMADGSTDAWAHLTA